MKKAIIVLLFLIGCAVGPNYESPQDIVPDEWHDAFSSNYSSEEPSPDWWRAFNDPLLDKLIEAAIEGNKQLLQATANILQARAVRQVSASKLFPQISTDLSAIKTYFSKNGPVFALTPGGGQTGGVSSPVTGLPFLLQIPQIQNLFTFLFDASWEIDLFGKTRRAVESADAQVDSAIEARNDTLVTVLAEVARNYLELRSVQERVRLTEEIVQCLTQMSEIVTAQLAAGYVNALDLDRISAELLSTQTALPELHAQIYRSIYTLSLLTGRFPENLVDDLIPPRPLPSPPPQVAVGLRSDLLRRRPDIRQRERDLASATADIGVAVASFYPTFTLLGDAGVQSLKWKTLFETASRTWAYGSDLNMPIFQGGKLVGNLRATEARCCMAGYQYQQTVLHALEEAERFLTAYSDDLRAGVDWRAYVARLQQIAWLTALQFEYGLVNRLVLLQARRQVATGALNLLENQTTTLIDLIALYKALGGAWQAADQCSSIE